MNVKKLLFVVIMLITLIGKNVYAEDEVYYTNRNGVSFTREQYDFYTGLMHEGYQEVVTQSMIDDITGVDLDTLDVNIVRLCPNEWNTGISMGNINHPQDDTYYIETSAKGLYMGTYCTASHCTATAMVEWFGEPNQKSYDLFGAFLDGPTLLGTPMVMVSSEVYSGSEETIKYETDGFGAVMKVPNGQEVYFDMSFMYTGTGAIFISYQHAMSSISLADSQSFHIDFSGYGNVFDFYGNAIGVYDHMPGVHMSV